MKSISISGSSYCLKFFDHLDFGILLLAYDFEILYVNRTACRFLKCAPVDLLGKNFTIEFAESLKIIQQIQQVEGVISNEKHTGELRRPAVPGLPVIFWVTNFFGISKESGECVLCFQPGNHDIRRSLPGSISLEKIIASLIHEIRNPLGGIVGFSNLLEQDLTHLKYPHEMILKILQAAESLEKLISSLTILSRDNFIGTLRPFAAQGYFGQLFLSFQQEVNQKKVNVICKKNFPQYDIFVSINPFSFNVLWEIYMQQLIKILQDKNQIIFKIGVLPGRVCFEISLIPDQNSPFSLTNCFRIPEFKRLMVEKTLQEHYGRIFSSDENEKNAFVRVELPQVFEHSTVAEKMNEPGK